MHEIAGSIDCGSFLGAGTDGSVECAQVDGFHDTSDAIADIDTAVYYKCRALSRIPGEQEHVYSWNLGTSRGGRDSSG